MLVEPLLEFGWYRENLRFVYPALELPATTETSWMEAIAAANPRLVICHTPDPETYTAPLRLPCDR